MKLPGPQVVLDQVEPALNIRRHRRAESRALPKAEREAFAKDQRRLVNDKVAELEAVRWRLDAILELATAAAREREPDRLAQAMCDGSRHIVASHYAGVIIGSPDAAAAELFVSSGLRAEERGAVGAHPSLDGLVRFAISRGKPVRLHSAARSRYGALPRGHPPVSTALVVPLPFHSLEGALYLADRLPGASFDQQDEAIAVGLAAQLAAAYEIRWLTADLQASVADNIAARRSLRVSERKFRNMLETSADSVVAVDSAGRISFVNQRVQTTFGYSPAELIGEPVEILVPTALADRHAHHREGFSRAPAGRAMGTGLDLAARRKDGTEFPVEISLSPVESADGMLVFAAIVDITGRKTLEAQLIQSQKMETVGQLAGGIAHDFNNLLTAISGYSELLAHDLGPDDARIGYVEGISKAAARAAGLTQQLLAFSRRQVLKPTVTDLNVVVRGVEPMLEQLVGDGVTLELDLAEGLPKVLADVGRLEQVIVNLAVNARDAMPGGGRLRIESREVELDNAYGLGHGAHVPAGRYEMLAVSDTGIGMDAATRARAFEPFFTTKEPGKGTGLGLSTVYGIVKQSGGYVWIYSEPGLGSTFKLYLPPTTAEASLANRSAPPESDGAKSGTVLVVDDDPWVLDILVLSLRQHGFRVLAAESPEVAMLMANDYVDPIDLLVTDVIMPGMTGPELAAKLNDRTPLRVLYMSGYSGDVIAGQRILTENLELLEKPFTPTALVKRVSELVGRGN